MMMDMPLATNMKFNSYGAFSELGYQLNDQYKVVGGARIDQVKIDAIKLNDVAHYFTPEYIDLNNLYLFKFKKKSEICLIIIMGY